MLHMSVINENLVLYLFVEEFEGQLKPHGLHVSLLEGGGDVHVHVEEALHGAALLRLLNLQLGEEAHEPLEGPLLPVDPEEIHLSFYTAVLDNVIGH